jgi:hypothetical protein
MVFPQGIAAAEHVKPWPQGRSEDGKALLILDGEPVWRKGRVWLLMVWVLTA